jgi:hypothetical protein
VVRTARAGVVYNCAGRQAVSRCACRERLICAVTAATACHDGRLYGKVSPSVVRPHNVPVFTGVRAPSAQR